MDLKKEILLAVAGSGKTTEILNKLNLEEKILLITYTDNNYNHLLNLIIEKFGYIPKNIKVYTYFTFLYRICFLPFTKNMDIKGLTFDSNNNKKAKQEELEYYLNKKTNQMYSNRLAKYCSINLIDNIIYSLEIYFNYIYIDEFQDFGGHDFNFILDILNAKCNFLLVGDFYQHTFNTSHDGITNINLYKNYDKYIKRLKKNKELIIDNESLINSKRCSIEVCDFIKSKIGIEIEAYNNFHSIVKEVEDPNEIFEILNNDEIIKLFYRESNKYKIKKVNNWGNCKGDTYKDVCIIVNQNTYEKYFMNKDTEVAQETINKFYVACSRPNRNLYFIYYKKIKDYKKS